MKTDCPGAGGDAGRDVDEFAADGAGSCLAEGPGGEDAGGPGEVVGHDRGNEPCRVRGENTGGHVGQGAVLQVGVHLLNLSVFAVGLVRGDRVQNMCVWAA